MPTTSLEVNAMMTKVARQLTAFLKNEEGPTAVEYAVMLALIIVVCIAAVTALGGSVSGVFSNTQLKTATSVGAAAS